MLPFNLFRGGSNPGSFLTRKLTLMFAAPAIFFFGVIVNEYGKPNSFVRANADKVVVFFMSTYAGKLILNPQRYESCITNAKADTPPSEVFACFLADK